MTIEERIENLEKFYNDPMNYDCPKTLELITEYKTSLENFKNGNYEDSEIPPWSTKEEVIKDLEINLIRLEEIRDYAIKYNIKSIL